MDAIPDSGAGVGSSSAARGRGLIGDATSATGATVGAATNTAGRAEGVGGSALNSTLNSASGVAGSSPAIGGLNASGQLTSNSRGVFNLNGISLNSGIDNETHGSVVTSTGKNVHLDSGIQMLLVVQSGKAN